MSGRSLPEAPDDDPRGVQQHTDMPRRKGLFTVSLCLIEPWDGPASIAFSDGSCIGAVLDRNGLRPSRYYITDDDICIMASEVGVVPVDSTKVVEKGRLQPGYFLDRFRAGRRIPDEELKSDLASRRPYKKW